MSYVDGFVLPVPKDKIAHYQALAEQAKVVWLDHGALDYKECVLEDATDNGFSSTFPKSFAHESNETIVFAYIVFKDRAHRDDVNKKVMEDPRMKDCPAPDAMPFDCKRMAYSGFKAIVEA